MLKLIACGVPAAGGRHHKVKEAEQRFLAKPYYVSYEDWLRGTAERPVLPTADASAQSANPPVSQSAAEESTNTGAEGNTDSTSTQPTLKWVCTQDGCEKRFRIKKDMLTHVREAHPPAAAPQSAQQRAKAQQQGAAAPHTKQGPSKPQDQVA